VFPSQTWISTFVIARQVEAQMVKENTWRYAPQHKKGVQLGITFQAGKFGRNLWTLGWTIAVLGFDSRWELGIFLFTTASRTALEPTQPPIQWVKGSLLLGVKRPGREIDHSPSSSAEVKE
jgi:hypothetical protein